MEDSGRVERGGGAERSEATSILAAHIHAALTDFDGTLERLSVRYVTEGIYGVEIEERESGGTEGYFFSLEAGAENMHRSTPVGGSSDEAGVS